MLTYVYVHSKKQFTYNKCQKPHLKTFIIIIWRCIVYSNDHTDAYKAQVFERILKLADWWNIKHFSHETQKVKFQWMESHWYNGCSIVGNQIIFMVNPSTAVTTYMAVSTHNSSRNNTPIIIVCFTGYSQYTYLKTVMPLWGWLLQ